MAEGAASVWPFELTIVSDCAPALERFTDVPFFSAVAFVNPIEPKSSSGTSVLPSVGISSIHSAEAFVDVYWMDV